MKRGTIAAFAGTPELLPTFAPSGRHGQPFVVLYLKFLEAQSFRVPPDIQGGSFVLWNGDLAEAGRGEILVWAGGMGSKEGGPS
jgi:hypothetical protein